MSSPGVGLAGQGLELLDGRGPVHVARHQQHLARRVLPVRALSLSSLPPAPANISLSVCLSPSLSLSLSPSLPPSLPLSPSPSPSLSPSLSLSLSLSLSPSLPLSAKYRGRCRPAGPQFRRVLATASSSLSQPTGSRPGAARRGPGPGKSVSDVAPSE